MKIRKLSNRSRLIKVCDKLMFEVLKKERGCVCEICGRTQGIGTFHILPKSTAPRLRYSKDNLLLVCWFPCHNLFHHDVYRAQAIIKKIKELRGEDFETRLRTLNAISPPLKTFELEKIKFGLEQFMEELK